MFDDRKCREHIDVFADHHFLTGSVGNNFGGNGVMKGLDEFELQFLRIIDIIEVSHPLSSAEEVAYVNKIGVSLNLLKHQDRPFVKGLLNAGDLIYRINLPFFLLYFPSSLKKI